MFSSPKQIPASDAQGESLAFRSGLLVHLIWSICSLVRGFLSLHPPSPRFVLSCLLSGGRSLPPSEELELLERRLRNYKSGQETGAQ